VITSYYDVVLLGTRFEALLCGALLAKRGFRVLVLGQGMLGPTYEVGGRRLPREPFAFRAAHSPVARRTLAELALLQVFRRRATAMDPAFQVVLPKHRIDLPPKPEHFERELDRELPDVKPAALEFHRVVERVGADLDRLFERDLLFPPETFFERREFQRARAGAHDFDRKGGGSDPFAEFPDAHVFRHLVGAPTFFASDMDPRTLSPLGTLRLYEGWRGAARLEGGYEWLRGALIDKIETYSGEVRWRERAEQVLLKRNTAVGVRLATSGETIGCGFVVSSCDVDVLLRLLPDRGAFRELFETLGEPTPRYFRYTLNVLVAADAVPAGMARDVFVLRDPRRPYGAENLLHVETHAERDGERLVTVQALLPRRGVEEVVGYLGTVRRHLLGALEEIMPFVRPHVRLVDSPHDGRDAQLGEGKTASPSEPWTRGPSTMPIVHGYPVRGPLGVAALPVRSPVKRLLSCSPQVVPGLGHEGSFVAAWSAARIVTRSDRKKEWMRRGLWTKAEM